jgi:DNA-binding transcriptional regulator YhcF (GntR family)
MGLHLENEELTTAQKNVLAAYRKWIDRYGDAPSLRQLAGELGVNLNAARYQLIKLESRGYLLKRPATGRFALSAKGKRAL